MRTNSLVSVIGGVCVATLLLGPGADALAAQLRGPGAAVRPSPALATETRTITADHGATVDVEAGSLRVPAHRDRPGGAADFELPFYRLRSTAADPGAPIFLLAGGPGASWLDRLEKHEPFEEVRLYRSVADVILFDQRGGGRSQPVLRCDGSEPIPLDRPLDLGEVAASMRRLSEACRDRLTAAGVVLEGLTTLESADDVDALRAALGYERMTLVGGSYGSHLALAVMRRFPDRIDRAVLHGVEGLDHTWDDPAGKWAALERIAAAAEADSALRGEIPEGGLLAALEAVIRRLEEEPATVVVRHEGEDVAVVVDAALVRLVSAAQAGHRGRAGAWPRMILELYRGEYERLAKNRLRNRTLRLDTPMHYMMDCASGVSPERAARYATHPASEVLGDINFEYRAVCGAWGAPDLGAAFRAPVVSDVPTLIVHGTWDTSTPLSNAHEVAAALSDVRLVEVEEGGHGALYTLLEHWEPMRASLTRFLRGEPVSFPTRVSLPRVSFGPRGGD